MPVTTSGTSLTQWIDGLRGKFNSPDLVQSLGNALAEDLVQAFQESGLQSQSGATVRALSYVGEPERSGNAWRIGVGDKDALGNEYDPAPRGTLRQFFNDNPGLKPTPWRAIPPAYKQQLELMRRAGMYGGRGPNYANYMWVQNAGNSAAGISGHGFIEMGLSTWRGQVPDLINEWWQSLGTLGRFKRTVAGVFGR